MTTGSYSSAIFPLGRPIVGVAASVGVGLALTALLSGCSGHIGDTATPEEIVAQRAQARWDAIIAGDWETAYSFASPAYRSLVDADGFRRRQGGQTWVLGTTVRKVECEVDTCEAVVRLKFNPPMPQFGTELETDYKERWVLDDSTWWLFLTP